MRPVDLFAPYRLMAGVLFVGGRGVCWVSFLCFETEFLFVAWAVLELTL